LFSHLGSLVGTTLNAVLIDSWEAGRQNWAQGFPESFRTARGYDLRPWVLAMTGRVVGSVPQANRFLFDVRRTHADMLSENYYGYFHTRLHALGLSLHAEPYGDGTFESLQIAEKLDVTMGEFWVRYTYGAKAYIDLTTSAAHTLGQPISACEAFTGAPLTSRWTGHPYALKAEGDRMFAAGVNRFVFHTFVHQPHPTVRPGMTMGPFGTHFDRNNTWMDGDTGYMRYLSRTQLMLQAGEPVVDLAVLKAEEPSSGVPDVRSGALAIPAGYAVDTVSAGALMGRAKVEDGRLVLRPGMSYRALVVPPLREITPALLTCLADLVRQGLKLITLMRPSGTPSLASGSLAEDEINRLVTVLWGDLDGRDHRQRQYGHGQILLSPDVDGVLREVGLKPDFRFTADRAGADILFHHRRIQGYEVYFVSNQRRRSEAIECVFRSGQGTPELWDAETGECTGVLTCTVEGDRTLVPLVLSPAGSVFVVFRRDVPRPTNAILPKRASMGAPVSLSQNFTVSVWALPETWCLPGTGFLALPEQGTRVYGTGCAVAGLAAGQNGVFVYEQSDGPPRLVLNSDRRLSGWTHVALAYREGRPCLYLDGEAIETGSASGQRIFAPRDTVSPPSGVPHYFEGNSTLPQLTGVMSAVEIRRLAQAGPPAPELPTGVSFERTLSGRLIATAWSPGSYRIEDGRSSRLVQPSIPPSATELTLPWRVELGSRSITLPKLIALNKHEEFDVRHFSGVARYQTEFVVEPKMLGLKSRLFLDLGRLDVIARVRVNGRGVGAVWKPPYRLSITDFVKAGNNTLDVHVTTLWPNRLIGDEHLPEENIYDAHGPILQLPEWYRAGLAKPGPRETFCVWHSYDRDSPLLQSGLIGPVMLLHGVLL
jgi:hypothetical protein